MSKLIKTLLTFCVCFILFTGCSENKKQVKYDLTICDSNLTELNSYLDTFSSENYHIETFDFSHGSVVEFIKSVIDNNNNDENISYFINSLVIYSENIIDDQAVNVINFAKKHNIPVIFAMSQISHDILSKYDKSYCIVTDYNHASETTAKKIFDMWKNSIIIDRDEDKILTFSVLKDATLPPHLELFYNSLIENIELYGVPLHKTEEINISDVASIDIFNDIINKVEGVIVISNSHLSFINEYTKDSEGINIIAYNQGSDNSYTSPYSSVCFVDYNNYKKATDELINNFNNKKHLAENISFPYTDTTISIPATI